MGKKLLSHILIVLGIISGIVAVGTIVYYGMKWRILNFFNNSIPNFILNLLIIAIIGCLIFIFFKLRKLPKDGSGELREDFEKYNRGVINQVIKK